MKLDKKDLVLYAITDRSWLLGESLASKVEEALKGGATIIQFRDKVLKEDDFLKEAIQIQECCKKYNVPFIINDSVHIAKEIDADGVHVGQQDMSLEEVRQKLGKDKIVGVSVKTVEQAQLAEKKGASYLGVGAVFPTSTKLNTSEVSYETLKSICEAVSIPVVAIGGIALNNIEYLKGSGISGVAVISAIFKEKNKKEAAARLKETTLKMLDKKEE